jgi:hypothetical protein
MCVFCAAIPATLAMGTVTESKRRQAQRDATGSGSPCQTGQISPLAVAGLAAIGLMVGSVLYHSGRLI